MPTLIAARYRARDGTEHRVIVQRTADGRRCVLDVTASTSLIVEALADPDDQLAQADALARDYAAEQQTFQLGLRDNPLPPRAAPTQEARCAA